MRGEGPCHVWLWDMRPEPFLPAKVSPSWCGIFLSPQLTGPVILEKLLCEHTHPTAPRLPLPTLPGGYHWRMSGSAGGPRRHSAPGEHPCPVPASVWTRGLFSLIGMQKLSQAALRSHHHQQPPARLPAGSGCWEVC